MVTSPRSTQRGSLYLRLETDDELLARVHAATMSRPYNETVDQFAERMGMQRRLVEAEAT